MHNTVTLLFSCIAICQYKEFLKMYYEDPFPYDDKLFMKNKRCYIELAIIEKDNKTNKEEDLNSLQDLERNHTVVLDDILKPIENGQPAHQVILIEGMAGIGKSTLAWRLCHMWAKEELDSLKDYDLVILVRLRRKRAQIASSLEDLLPCDKDMKGIVAAIGRVKRVLFVCDGLDELPHTRMKSGIYLNLFNGLLLPEATIIVTTRPSAGAEFKSICQRKIRKLEITGFTAEGITEFVKSIFSSDAAKNFLSYTAINPRIHSMMYIPLSAVIIAHIYLQKRSTSSLKFMSELFDSFTCVLVRRHLESMYADNLCPDFEIPSSLHDISKLPLKVASQFLAIAKIAYNGIRDNMYDFNELGIYFNHLGLMRRVSCRNVERGRYITYVFFHVTLQEYLAALYVANSLVGQLVSSEAKDLHNILKKNNMIVRFLAGICVNNHHDYSTILYQWLRKFLSRTCFDRSQSLQLVHCAIECPKIMQGLKVDKELENEYIVIEPEVGIDWFAMGYCISHFNEKWGLRIYATNLRKENIDLLKKGLDEDSPQKMAPGASLKYLYISNSNLLAQVFTSLHELCHLERIDVSVIEDDLNVDEDNKVYFVYNKDLPALTSLIQSLPTLQVLKLGLIVGYNAPDAYCNLQKLVEVAVQSEKLKLYVHQVDYDNLPKHISANPIISSY